MKSKNLYFALGRPFSPLYGAAMRGREWAYAKGLFTSHCFPVPVISVGNLTMGGTGKTPMVQFLAQLLQAHGSHPAIISRGYGGTATEAVNVVSDGTQILLSAQLAGDEPRFLAETLPGVPVLTGPVRRLTGGKALEMGADILLLDDGFQHLQIKRTGNLVLFNADRLAGNSRIFPGGDLREPVAALSRATHFILTGVTETNQERAGRFAELLKSRFASIPTFFSGYEVQSARRLAGPGHSTEVDLAELTGKTCFAFCGIAHDAAFRRTLEQQGLRIGGFLPFADHQPYTEQVVSQLLKKAERAGVNALVTTEKDLVKLAEISREWPLPLYAICMRVTADTHLQEAVLAVANSMQGAGVSEFGRETPVS